jgi:putative hemin transport protein
MENLMIDKTDVQALKKAWEEIQAAQPNVRIRNAAQELGVSEAELLATEVGPTCVRLDATPERSWPDFLKRLPELGYVMSLTRNDACVLEHKGKFQKVETFGEGERAMGTVIGPIETRVFFSAWHVGFAHQMTKGDRTLTSLQIFDKAGEAITKIYLQEKSNNDAFLKIVEDYRSDNQEPGQTVEPYSQPTFGDSVDKPAFLQEWSELKDTHDFFGMLKRHNVHRYKALEVANGTFSYPISTNNLQLVLETAASTKLPIMIFAGNRGNVQIQQGKVKTIRLLESQEKWLNVLDPEFNMHLKLEASQTAWVVRKPTSEGNVTSIEVFDAEKNMIAQFFGLRKPGIPELEAWKQLVDSLPKL